jgi:hypothetical protein
MTDRSNIGVLTRRLVLAGLAAAAGVGVAGLAAPWHAAAQSEGLSEAQSIEISARALAHFQRSRPDIKRFGELEFRGGLVLTSPAQDFGGWSGLVMEPDGKKLLAVSDAGSWLTAELAYEGGRPVGLARARMGSLRATSGRLLKDKREQDAEAIALVDGTLARGTLLVGFERVQRIGRFDIRDGQMQAPSGYIRLPAEAARMQANQGLEALAVIRAGPLQGSLVAFAERFTRGSGYHTGWIWVRGTPQRFQLRDIDGFNITDAAGLPDGGLLVLERYFRWTTGVKMRIRRLLPGEIAPGARLTGRILLEADSDYEIDNMEGIAVHRGSNGETVVSLISDDNFNHLLQRTVFLQFTLLGDDARSTTKS